LVDFLSKVPSVDIEKISSILKEQIKNFGEKIEKKNYGVVVSLGDGIANVYGLSGASVNELVEFEDQDRTIGMVLNLEEELVGVVLFGEGKKIKEGNKVFSTGKQASVCVGEELIGRVVNPLGEALDGQGKIPSTELAPIERKATGIIERKSVFQPLQTGIISIDSMIPIGRGQRELIIGDRQTGKTTIAIDTIINQKGQPKETRPICVYVAIGQKQSNVAKIYSLLEEKGAMEYTTIVFASCVDSPALQFIAPFAGASIAEKFMFEGRDTLVVYDDLTKHANAYRTMSLLLRRPPGREAFPGDVFYLHSRLLERAAKLSDDLGGGSMTALPIIETQAGDVSAYIPTNVISITDGQIFLESNLFNSGIRPAINVGISVSRVGGAAQTKAMKKQAGKIRIELAQFEELEAFSRFSSEEDLTQATLNQIKRGKRTRDLLIQRENSPLSLACQVSLIFGLNQGLYDQMDSDQLELFKQKWAEDFKILNIDFYRKLDSGKDLEDSEKKELKKLIQEKIDVLS